MKIRAIILLIAIALHCICINAAFSSTNISSSVVKIYVTSNSYDYAEPWQMLGQETATGSGCIISGNRILTNAHVVGDQIFIQVKRAGESEKYTAEVSVVDHDCDLAILQVKDEKFFDGINPLEIGDLPKAQDRVAVYGFPEGGDELSITEGVVSRVEHTKYAHSESFLLACQIDAAINAGNSGGPVIADGKVVGVAFQGLDDTDNIGYMVPAPIINHFLEDIKDGKHDGIPELGVNCQNIENPDIRAAYKMGKEQSGVLVNSVYPDSPAQGKLRKGDIILSLDGVDIKNDGTIRLRKNERTYFEYIIQNKQMHERVKLEVLREGKIITEELELTSKINSSSLVPNSQYDVEPTYYIVGGLVFEPLTMNFIQAWEDNDYEDATVNMLYYYMHGQPKEDRREIVMLSMVLADEINVGYHDIYNLVITHVNDKKISEMKDLVRAFEEHEGKYHTVVDEEGQIIIVDKAKVDKFGQLILDKFNIGSDRSDNLSK